MPPDSPLSAVARVIQLSVAPVFLLTALGTMLSVFSTRLGRIVDRARVLVQRLPELPEDRREAARTEVRHLIRRRHFVNAAITFGVVAALLVCVLIATAFIGSVLHWDTSHTVAGLFIAAMVAFIGGLLCFLSEVLYATGSFRLAEAPTSGKPA